MTEEGTQNGRDHILEQLADHRARLKAVEREVDSLRKIISDGPMSVLVRLSNSEQTMTQASARLKRAEVLEEKSRSRGSDRRWSLLLWLLSGFSTLAGGLMVWALSRS